MKKNLVLTALAAVMCLCSCGPKDGEYTFQLFTTNDVHGTYFDSLYVDGAGLMSAGFVNTREPYLFIFSFFSLLLLSLLSVIHEEH